MKVAYAFTNLGWHPYPEQGSFYRMEEGILKYMPMRSDGSMVVEEIGEVNFDLMTADDARRCREIEIELESMR